MKVSQYFDHADVNGAAKDPFALTFTTWPRGLRAGQSVYVTGTGWPEVDGQLVLITDAIEATKTIVCSGVTVLTAAALGASPVAYFKS